MHLVGAAPPVLPPVVKDRVESVVPARVAGVLCHDEVLLAAEVDTAGEDRQGKTAEENTKHEHTNVSCPRCASSQQRKQGEHGTDTKPRTKQHKPKQGEHGTDTKHAVVTLRYMNPTEHRPKTHNQAENNQFSEPTSQPTQANNRTVKLERFGFTPTPHRACSPPPHPTLPSRPPSSCTSSWPRWRRRQTPPPWPPRGSRRCSCR